MFIAGLILFVTLVLLLFLLSMVWPPDSPWSPWWRTNERVACSIVKTAGITKDDLIYDLGCGDGVVLVTAAVVKGAKGVGVEIDPSRVFLAKLRAIIRGVSDKVTIHRGDLFSAPIRDATVVIVYLIPKTLKRLEAKFLKELKPGTRVVSYIYPIPYLPETARDEKEQVYVYEIPQKRR